MVQAVNTPLLCAHLASLAYKDVTLADLRPFGMTWIQVVENGASYAFLCGDGYRVHVSHRGSNDSQDWMWDFKFGKTDFPVGGRVHRGFKMAHDKIWPEMNGYLNRLDPTLPRILDGHSLGAAMTQLTAAHLCGIGTPPEQCHVFGCPRVGNEDFVRHITCPGDRWEARLDPVTGIPLRWGPIQTEYALRHGRTPTMFTQPWTEHTVDSWFHSMGVEPDAEGYLAAMKAL